MDFRQEQNSIIVHQVTRPVRVTHFDKSEYSVGTLILAPLLPFKKTMRLQLQQRGYNTDRMTWKAVAAAYYNEFVSNRENTKSQYAQINEYEFRNNVAFRLRPSDDFEVDYFNKNYFNQVSDVTKNIIDSFKFSKLKKKINSDNYETALTDEEQLQASHAEAVETRLEYKALDTRTFRWGDLKALLITALIVWLLFYLVE